MRYILRTVEHFDSSFNCSTSSSSLIRRAIVDFFLFLSRSLFNKVDTLVETIKPVNKNRDRKRKKKIMKKKMSARVKTNPYINNK